MLSLKLVVFNGDATECFILFLIDIRIVFVIQVTITYFDIPPIIAVVRF